MKFYLAPMEGVTGYIYRNAYHAHFRPMDKYFTPFLAPKHNGGFSHREMIFCRSIMREWIRCLSF